VPIFSPNLQRKLTTLVPPVGTSTRNPVDVGSPFPFPSVLRSVLETVLIEDGVDLAIVSELYMSTASHMLGRMDNSTLDVRLDSVVAELAQVPVEIKQKLGKPLVMVLPVEAMAPEHIEAEEARRKVAKYYLAEGIPVFLTLERAVKALANVVGYYEQRDAIASSD